VSFHDELTCLWVQEVNHRQKYRVEDSPYNPELPSNTLNSDRSDLNDSKVGDPAQSRKIARIRVCHDLNVLEGLTNWLRLKLLLPSFSSAGS
jgi:hypothetical protein